MTRATPSAQPAPQPISNPLPSDAHSCYRLGLTQQQQGQQQAAQALYDRALALDPRLWPAWVERGGLRLNLGLIEGAINDLETALRLDPQHARTWFQLGLAWNQRGRPDRALDCFRQARLIDPSYSEAHYNCGVIEYDQGDLIAAAASNRQAIAHQPTPIMAYSNLGIVLEALGDRAAAMASYNQAIAHDPNDASAYWNKALLHLRQGDYAAGWPLYEWRWAAGKAGVPLRRFLGRPLWLGKAPLAGRTILVHSEQGLGDMIQFARFIPELITQGAYVVFETFTPLLSLFGGSAGFGNVIGMDAPRPRFDLHCPMMSLPLALGITLDTLPRKHPYITPDPVKSAEWGARLGITRRARVGFVWSGNSKFPGNPRRTVPLEQLQTILALPVDFVCLQKDVTASNRAILDQYPNVRVVDEDLGDFADIAAVIAQCDLVISVDTSCVHLAGAMGKPTWLMLSAHPDWRWLETRSDSPWYPSARLFRQTSTGQWDSVICEIEIALEELLRSPGG